MARAWTPEGAADTGGFANVFVLIALVAMLIGTVLILAARDPGSVDVPPGEAVDVVHYTAPDWDPFGHPLSATVPTNQSFNITTRETTGTGKGEAADFNNSIRWDATAEPGETWVATITNNGNETIRVGTTVSHNLLYVSGGILVGVGILGFVSYRMGMRRAGP